MIARPQGKKGESVYKKRKWAGNKKGSKFKVE